MTPHTDIISGGWIARLPPGAVPYVHLARLDRPIGAWLLFLPGLWSISLAAPDARSWAWLTLLFLVGSFVMRAAGCVINDMWDREMDRNVARTAGRPLAAGTIRMRGALVFLAILLAAGLVILLQLNRGAQLLGVASLLLVVTYPLAKRVTWWPQLMLGFTFGWGAPMGYAACGRPIDAVALALYAAAILWILGYDTIYAHQDREDDALIGVRSTARLFATRTGPFLWACYGGMLLLLGVVGGWSALNLLYFIAIGLPAALLVRQIRKLDIHDPALCLKLFRNNREVGFAIGLALLLGRL